MSLPSYECLLNAYSSLRQNDLDNCNQGFSPLAIKNNFNTALTEMIQYIITDHNLHNHTILL